ncbi:MAG TPA: Gfo/Idh/MocA family oxidoreductase [Candidatus Hydrogenedentes bacterium]|nr:Gfo/Idh/MocA family oxidoreductase [Candidatus Hydrogenedentota bacterium]HPG68330.1 Gfo/Idh/MocA family oxidoreductase [Candidatus Hydrogenedentota bacterium]
MPKPVRLGIIGCGKIATVAHVPGYQALRDANIVSLLDIKPRQMDTIRAACNFDAQGFTDFDAFVASGLDAVSICTPNCFHYPQTMACLKAGLHVLSEKPMAATPAETTRMIAAAKKAGKVLQINQSLRYHPLYQKIADLVAQGEIGEPIHVRCLRSGGSTPDKGWSPGATWFVSKKFQGGVVLDIAVHMADLMKWVAGDVRQICAYTDTRIKGIDVTDNATALMRFANGATGVLELSWSTPCGGGLFEVYGTTGTIRAGFSGERPIELIKPGAAGKGPKVTYPKPKAKVKESFECFIAAIRGKAPSPTPGELGRDAIALCDAIARSGASGRFVNVPQF